MKFCSYYSVVEPGRKAWKRIRKEFGDAVFHSDGSLNRPALGQIVFSKLEKRKLLNSITHPEIYKSIFFRCVKYFFMGHQFVVIDVPLLYESGKMVRYIEKTIVVACEPQIQLERLMARDNLSENDAVARINAQMPLKDKIKLADFIITSNGSKDETKVQVESVVEQLRELKIHWKYRIIAFGCFLIPASLIGVGAYKFFMYLL
ncbi:dephospho-CoA kinase domain-containing protein-like isoform X2 [Stegodyphus dumicola]|uniref:dephospho-CoA kinase domain-containing protein-like isoform X2 n=1 Tax=Stegodyphus dumicola TaxID=202533 RepID=UPI0015ACC25A|nr:dephospho-CoA kinase domain-containing protein-like isoform X2 [Stegodyphus dumicola]